jgi:hypothetical protein
MAYYYESAIVFAYFSLPYLHVGLQYDIVNTTLADFALQLCVYIVTLFINWVWFFRTSLMLLIFTC